MPPLRIDHHPQKPPTSSSSCLFCLRTHWKTYLVRLQGWSSVGRFSIFELVRYPVSCEEWKWKITLIRYHIYITSHQIWKYKNSTFNNLNTKSISKLKTAIQMFRLRWDWRLRPSSPPPRSPRRPPSWSPASGPSSEPAPGNHFIEWYILYKLCMLLTVR